MNNTAKVNPLAVLQSQLASLLARRHSARSFNVRSLSDGRTVRSTHGHCFKSPAPVALPYAYCPKVGDTSWHATAAEALAAMGDAK